jgi:hypothetical protein
MNWRWYIRPLISVCAAALLAIPVSFGAGAVRVLAQARLLDHAEFLCDNCFFGASDFYYCFAVDKQILIAYQRTRVLNWRDKSKNYLSNVHHGWAAWTAPGQTVPVTFDDKYIWVTRADDNPVARNFWEHLEAFASWASRGNSKQVRLMRSSMREIFSPNCRVDGTAAAH